MLTITNQSNYLAKVVQLGKPQKHPNADKLLIWNVSGYEVITDLSSKEGDIKVFFPVECQIHDTILSYMNMYAHSELNQDKTKIGYISDSRRIKAVKLRGVVSDGIVLPIEKVIKSIDSVRSDGADTAYSIGELFDTVYGIVICNKYVPPVKEIRSGGGQGQPKKNPVKEFLIDGQFNFHYDTSKLPDNAWRFQNEDDEIVITDKWHGTSAIFSNVLTKRKLSIWQKLGRFFGNDIPREEYSKMYASRSVLKSIEGKYHTPDQGYYNTDIWGKVFEDVKHVLFPGYTLYGEIVGYTGEKMIQKGYDYGCKPEEHRFLVYRVTVTSPFDGQVREYSREDIADFCKEHKLECVPELYRGTLKDFMTIHSDFQNNESLLDCLKRIYLEQDCIHCKTKVPAEGICIRNESGSKIAYKLKSKRFLLGESAALDAGEEVVE